VSVIAVAYPRAKNRFSSTGLAEDLRVPASPPTPRNTNLPFQLAGNITSKFAEPGPAPSPLVLTEPFKSQYWGLGATAGTSLAEVIVTLGIPWALSAATEQSVAEARDAPKRQKNKRPIDGTRAVSLLRSAAKVITSYPPEGYCGFGSGTFAPTASLSREHCSPTDRIQATRSVFVGGGDMNAVVRQIARKGGQKGCWRLWTGDVEGRALSDAQFADVPLRRRLPFRANSWSIFGAT